MPLDPNITATAAVTTAIGWTMLFSGRRKRMLTQLRPKRCPSCGRLVGRRAVCDRH